MNRYYGGQSHQCLKIFLVRRFGATSGGTPSRGAVCMTSAEFTSSSLISSSDVADALWETKARLEAQYSNQLYSTGEIFYLLYGD